MLSPRSHPRNRRSGFALLITITLLAFLVLLLVSLAALTRVETQVASNNQQLSQARQNALMALNVALGKLQESAGPDQRVTATADLDPASAVTNRHWTGVWDSNPTSPTYRQRVSWLVSGETPDVTAPVADPGPGGVSANVVRLVGEHSTDLADQAASDRNRVDVPLEEIRSELVPGLAAAPGGHLVGRFGYWVGDEGVKAKVSLSDPWQKPAPEDVAATSAFNAMLTATETSEANAETFSFFGLQRTGIEGVSASGDNTVTTAKIEGAYPLPTNTAFRTALPKVLSLSQLPLSPTPNQAVLNTAIKSRFHDLTASSFSVLADVSAGGLKRDLTAWAATPVGPSNLPLDSDYILPPGYTLPADPAEHYGLPKWGIIRSYADITADGTAKGPTYQTDQQQGLYPVMTFGRLGIAASCEGEGQPLKLHIFPHLVLWNPTNVPITGTYEFCFGFTGDLRAFFKFDSYAATSPLKMHVDLSGASLDVPTTPSSNLPRAYFRFRVEMPEDGIAPGQSLAFTLSRDGYHPYVPGDPGNPLKANLPIAPDNSVTLDGPTMSADDLTHSIYLAYRYADYGQLSMLLCPVPTAANPTPAELLASAYQAVLKTHNFGQTYKSPAVSTAQPADTVLAPTLDYRVVLRMSRKKDGSVETPRWLANINPRADVYLRRRSQHAYTTSQEFVVPPRVLGNENSAAEGEDPSVLNSTVVRSTLFEFQPSGVPLFSLAQLQHASLSSINLNPAYPVGNAVADYYCPLDETSYFIGADSKNPDSLRRVYDLSWLLNQTLWDRYFFSTVPATLTAPDDITANYRLPNSRHEFQWNSSSATQAEIDELKTTEGAAAHLLVNGGFNVNSTSVQAWRALLYSHNADPSQPAAAAFSRFSRPTSDALPNGSWNGWRVLTEAQIDHLAARIVEQVKARGPFLSLADFVNRSLVDDPATAEDERLKGALQAALDAPSSADNVNFTFPFRGVAPGPDGAGRYRITSYPSGTTEEQKVRYRGGPDTTATYASMAAFVPGFLTQADLLNALGPVLTARSDTFRIRAYGDVLNPATGDLASDARAWCEAIVQRLPDYVDADGNDATVAPASANAVNQTFGRRFKIVSFQWLSANDI